MAKLLPALVLLAVAGLPAAAFASEFVFRYRAGAGADGGQTGGSQPGGPTAPGAGTSDGGQPGASTGNGAASPQPDRTPATIDFGSWLNQRPGVETLSSVRRLTDHDEIELAVSGGSDASLRLCADASCGSPSTGWVTAATAPSDAYVQLRQVSADFGPVRDRLACQRHADGVVDGRVGTVRDLPRRLHEGLGLARHEADVEHVLAGHHLVELTSSRP